MSQLHGLVCHWVLGDLRVVEARLPGYLRAAGEKNDLLMATNLLTMIAPHLHLIQDDPDRAQSGVLQAMEQWSSKGYHVQHHSALVAQVNIHLYQGKPELAWELIAAQWRPLRNSFLLRVQALLITALELRARTALALAETLPPRSRGRKRYLKSARADMKALKREHTPFADALVLKLQALEAAVEDRWPEAAALCLQAEIAFGACDMATHVMAVRYVRSRLEGSLGAKRMGETDQWLRGQGVVRPERFVRMHLPVSWPTAGAQGG